MSRFQLDEIRIAEFCRAHHIRKLALFGSVLGDAFAASSDVDVLVEFEAGKTPGLIAMAGLERELSAVVGRRVDLRTPRDISRYVRDRVIADSEVHYVHG